MSAVAMRDMAEIIRHRGPDDEGYALFGAGADDVLTLGGRDTPAPVYEATLSYAPKSDIATHQESTFQIGLMHRRLAILDVSSAGHQPMCTPDERYWIVFNGEVYNHVELRIELETMGYVFNSHSDTEVILAAYSQWGKDCLSRFNGMFAFLIYDRERQCIFAARDRFGIKPLYYWVSEHGVAFASEIKQFTMLPHWRARMNGQRVYDFLNWGITDHTDETMFDGVFQLRGGQSVEIDVAEVRTGKNRPEVRLPVDTWYSLAAQPFSGDFEQAAAGFRDRLQDAVRLQLRADVPVGSCLSGGLDSSSIVGLMNRILGDQHAGLLQKTFSACSDVKRFDEREYIDEVVGQLGVEAHYVYPSLAGLFEMYQKITWHQDEPFGSTSIFAQWQVFGLAAQNGVKVMLDGQGADEQLAGYHTFFAPHFAGLFKRMKWRHLWSEIRATKRLHGYSELDAVKRIANMLMPEILRQRLRAYAGKASATPAWLSFSLLKAKPRDPFSVIGYKTDSIREFSRGQLVASNLQMLLHWEDRDSMAHSVESRVPFLDHHLVEFVLGLPDEYKLQDGVTKRVLREGMRGVIPELVRSRIDKLGFATPEEVWLREQGASEFRAALDDAIKSSQGVLNDYAREVLEEMIAGRRPFSFLVWRMISFGAWMKQFKVVV